MRFADKTTIYIPTSLCQHSHVVRKLVDAVTKSVGGCSSAQVTGQYVTKEGRVCEEDVTCFSWWQPAGGWVDLIELIRFMIKSGEECVLVEYVRYGHGEWAELMYASDVGL